jgi:hypothetical protein
MRRARLASPFFCALAAAPLAAQVETAPVVVPLAPSAAAAPALSAAFSPTALVSVTAPPAPALSAPLRASAVLSAPALAAASAPPAVAAAAPAPALSYALPEPAAAAEAAPAPAPDGGARAGAPRSAARGTMNERFAAFAGGGAESGLAFDGGAALERRAFPVEPSEFPGGSGALLTDPRRVRALLTKDIAAADLPYSTALREPRPVSLPATLAEVRPAPVRAVTDVAFASVEHSGGAALVRLGSLRDGRPVALKAYHLRPEEGDPAEIALEEARSAKLLSDLGVGPIFHGLWRDPEGNWNVVFDIARGDFSGTPINDATLRDLETILARLRGAGVEHVSDFHLYRDHEGRLTVIDPGTVSRLRRDRAAPADDFAGFATQARLDQLKSAPEDVGRRYLLDLRARRPGAFRGLAELVARRSDDAALAVRARWPDLLGGR